MILSSTSPGAWDMKKIASLTLVLFSAIALLACSGNETIDSDMGISGAPDWVNEGTQAVSDRKGQLIQGIGMAPPMNDPSLQKSTADNRARAEVARVLSTFIDSTINDYSSSNGDTNISNIERDIRSASKLALNGAIIKGNWKNKKTGDIYSFAELDMEKVDKAIETAASMNANFKSYFSKNKDANFKRFTEDRQE
jgi:hypothetical protein